MLIELRVALWVAGGNDDYLITGRGVSSVGFVESFELDSG